MRGPQGRGRCQVSLGHVSLGHLGHEGQGSVGTGDVGGSLESIKEDLNINGCVHARWLSRV